MGTESARITKKQVVMLQVVRRRQGIGDELWVEMKRSMGVASTTELSQGQMNALLRRMGAEPDVAGAGAAQPLRKAVSKRTWQAPEHRERMIAKMGKILDELDLPWSYADGIARKMHGVDSIRFCTADQTFRVLQGIMVYHRRQLKKRGRTQKGGVE